MTPAPGRFRSCARRVGACTLACLALFSPHAPAAPLTLEEVLAHAEAPHPDLELARARHAQAQADVLLAESQRDLRITLEAALRGGRNTQTERYAPDHLGRIHARKTLWDAHRSEAQTLAARLEQEARALQLMDARSQRRYTLMARFFDVLLADLQHAVDTEMMAVHFVRWDDAKHRHELGEISAARLAELEAAYQEVRLRQRDSERKARERRALLAAAMNRPEDLPVELADPPLEANDRALPPFETLLAAMQRGNPALQAHERWLAASRNRLQALRDGRQPILEFEAEAAAYSRESSTRDHLRAGLNLVWPLYPGRQHDALLAQEQSRLQELQAQYERLQMELRQALYETWQEIQHLREVERRAAEVHAHYRDLALDRARAEYEVELRTNLGTSMAETQAAKLRRRAVEYRLALAWERLAGLTGTAVPSIAAEERGGK